MKDKKTGTDLSEEQVTDIVKKRKPKNGLEVMKDFGAAPGENARFIRFAIASIFIFFPFLFCR